MGAHGEMRETAADMTGAREREREMCVFGQNVLMFDRCQNSFVVVGGTFCSGPVQNRKAVC